VNSAAIFSALPPPDSKPVQNPRPPVSIQEGSPWAFFDGASQNNKAGAGLCIFLKHDHILKASVGLGLGSNNFAELSALHLLLCRLIKINIFAIQIFGDSLNVINWVNGSSSCHNQILQILLDEIMHLKASFNQLSICHTYRENNEEADKLSKDGLQQNLGCWTIEALVQGQTTLSHQPPFAPPL